MFIKTVARISLFQLVHITVTEYFCKDGGGRNACDSAIAFDDRHLLFGGDTTNLEVSIDGD